MLKHGGRRQVLLIMLHGITVQRAPSRPKRCLLFRNGPPGGARTEGRHDARSDPRPPALPASADRLLRGRPGPRGRPGTGCAPVTRSDPASAALLRVAALPVEDWLRGGAPELFVRAH